MTLVTLVNEELMVNAMEAVSVTGHGLWMTPQSGPQLMLTADVNLRKTLIQLQMTPFLVQTKRMIVMTIRTVSGQVLIGPMRLLMLSLRMEWYMASHKRLKDASMQAKIS